MDFNPGGSIGASSKLPELMQACLKSTKCVDQEGGACGSRWYEKSDLGRKL
jgi:hypothetical protein